MLIETSVPKVAPEFYTENIYHKGETVTARMRYVTAGTKKLQSYVLTENVTRGMSTVHATATAGYPVCIDTDRITDWQARWDGEVVSEQ